MKEIVITVLIFAGLGALFGALLAVASKVFAVKVDERIPKIMEKLPGANCGGCGYSGCAALADAIVRGDARPDACNVCEAAAAREIAAIMGEEIGDKVRMRAFAACSGHTGVARKKFVYSGADDCISASHLAGGEKLCAGGCLGLGTCMSACAFGAISINNGVAKVDPAKCSGCGSCVAVCPKNVLRLVPAAAKYYIGCGSTERGVTTVKQCDTGCIGCKICEKNCEVGAIKVVDNLAVIDYSKCTSCGTCYEKCPKGIIKC